MLTTTRISIAFVLTALLGFSVSALAEDAPADIGSSGILAWDPIGQRAAWKHENTGVINAGTMTTAGNLVFQGLADGRFIAYENIPTSDINSSLF